MYLHEADLGPTPLVRAASAYPGVCDYHSNPCSSTSARQMRGIKIEMFSRLHDAGIGALDGGCLAVQVIDLRLQLVAVSRHGPELLLHLIRQLTRVLRYLLAPPVLEATAHKISHIRTAVTTSGLESVMLLVSMQYACI